MNDLAVYWRGIRKAEFETAEAFHLSNKEDGDTVNENENREELVSISRLFIALAWVGFWKGRKRHPFTVFWQILEQVNSFGEHCGWGESIYKS